AEERQVRGYALGRVPAWHLYALALFDDMLYALVLVLAIAGLLAMPGLPLKSLTILWVLLWVAMSFVFFAVTRFRLPVVAALLPWAGAGASMLLPVRGIKERFVRVPLASRAFMLALIVAVLVVVLPGISFADVQL